jgi:hypothetical protein
MFSALGSAYMRASLLTDAGGSDLADIAVTECRVNVCPNFMLLVSRDYRAVLESSNEVYE